MRLRGWARILAASSLAWFTASPASAQPAPPPIGYVVLDVRGTVPMFGQDEQLAASRGLAVSELPGAGLGLDLGAHVYPLRWKAFAVGIGGQLTLGRSTFTPPQADGTPAAPSIRETFTAASPQLSLNFGNALGWSYLSAGLGLATRAIVPDGREPLAADEEGVRTLNYGGGARWFARPHLAFTFDVRFYAMDPGPGSNGLPGSPRTTFMVLGAGVSIK